MIKTPILLLLYNRPGITKNLLEQLASINSFVDIYISIDGPKKNKFDAENVNKVYEIVNEISFAQNIYINKFEKNQGCKTAISKGITWFFENVEQGIIIEDDCFPKPEFFIFMEQMLEVYKNDSRIAQICGYNTLGVYENGNDYLYSNFGSIWGWGSWKRAWKFYDLEMKSFNNSYKSKLNLRRKIYFLGDSIVRIKNFTDVKNNRIDTWDFQWIYSRLSQNMLCVIPKVSLTINNGIGINATHTFSNMKKHNTTAIESALSSCDWHNLSSPQTMIPDYEFELKVAEFKRGFRGIGPLYVVKKLSQHLVNLRYLFKKK